MAKIRNVWRVRYRSSPLLRVVEVYTTDRGLARRIARHGKLVGWTADVNRVALRRARIDHSFDPWGEPLKLTPPRQRVQSNTYRRKALRAIARMKG